MTTFGYDTLSRPTSLSNPGIQATALVQQTYTPDGLPATLTDGKNNTTSFNYDRFDRLSTITFPLGSTETFTYDANSNVLTRKTRAGGTITFGYDTLNRLATKTPPSAPVVSYGYDRAGRLRSVGDTSAAITSAVSPTGSTVSYGTQYTYDKINSLTGATWSPVVVAAVPPAGSSATFSHTYNAVNQRVRQSADDNSWINYPASTPVTTGYVANALNQYTAVGPVSPTYDSNGNLTSDGTYTFGYDIESRLVSASGAGNTASYAYDAQSRRKSRTVNGATTIVVTDPDNREVLEYNGTTGQVLSWYAYGLGPNDVLGQMDVSGNTRTTPVPDQLASIIGRVDATTGSLTKFRYLPYGAATGPPTPFGYTGQRLDLETGGLYYYRARHYSPVLGRFLQTDPIGYTGYTGGSSLYSYADNDPLNSVDPSGLSAAAAIATQQVITTMLQSVVATQVTQQAIVNAVSNATLSQQRNVLLASLQPSAPAQFGPAPRPVVGFDFGTNAGSQFAWDPTRVFEGPPCLLAAGGSQNPCAGGGGIRGGGGGSGGVGPKPRQQQPQIANPPIINFKSEHYSKRLIQRGIDPKQVEQAVRARILPDANSIGGQFRGRFEFNGITLEYRGSGLPSGQIDIGTIFKVE